MVDNVCSNIGATEENAGTGKTENRPVEANVSSLSKLAATTRFCGETFAQASGAMASHIARVEQSNQNRPPRHIAFVAPQLPHPCELTLWNRAANRLGVRATVITARSEERSFAHFINSHKNENNALLLECIYLDSISENRTFLAGIDEHLKDANLVVAVGETSLSTYQALKARRQRQNRLVVWQTSPRPPEASIGSRVNGMPQPDLARQKAMRREVLRSCDAIISFDKECSTWAYLENVNSQRIRRISRGIDLKHFTVEMNASQRLELRAALGLPEADFIFLQAGPLEVESGALDSVYSFKSLLQSHPSYLNNTKLVFCGTGSCGADVRQAVVDLQLDNHVFFLNPNDPGTKEIIGNQMVNLLAISDAIIHNPLAAVNSASNRNLDCTYDLLCAMASGLTVISNGNGWIGDYLSRFYKTFSSSNIHSQSRAMREAIEKQEKISSIKRNVRKTMESELALDKAAAELASTLHSIIASDSRLDGNNVAELLRSIEELVRTHKYLDAIQLISAAFADPALTTSQRAMLFRHIGDCFTKLGDLTSGAQNYLRALELDSLCAKSLIGLGTVALQRRDYNAAVPHFQRAVSIAPKDHFANLGLSLAFEGIGELKQSLQWSARACHLNIEDTAAIFTMVRLAHELQEFEDAEKILSRYVGLHPHDVNMTFALGGIAFQSGNLEMAQQLMETILSLDPMNSRAHGLLAQIQRKSEQRKQA
jgi:tetratricopeptide (TPR) repeat protein